MNYDDMTISSTAEHRTASCIMLIPAAVVCLFLTVYPFASDFYYLVVPFEIAAGWGGVCCGVAAFFSSSILISKFLNSNRTHTLWGEKRTRKRGAAVKASIRVLCSSGVWMMYLMIDCQNNYYAPPSGV